MCTPSGQRVGISGVAAYIDGNEVSNSEFIREYRNQTDRLKQQYGDKFDARSMQVAARTMEKLVSDWVLYIKAREIGLWVDEDYVISYLKRVKAFRDDKGNFSEQMMKNWLREYRYTESTFLNSLQRQMTVEKLASFAKCELCF